MGPSDQWMKNLKALFAPAAEAGGGPEPFSDGDDNEPVPNQTIELAKLMPTQIAVGMLQVERKQKRLRELADDPEKLTAYITERPIRVVMGPEGKAYVIDHHHLGLALIREKHVSAPMVVEADYSHLPEDKFWEKMQQMRYVHPFDSKGVEKPYSDIPKSLTAMEDDPYRSLASYVREEGGFKKVRTPFAEFAWADFFRTRIPEEMIRDDLKKAIKLAVKLARKPEAKKLPGFKP